MVQTIQGSILATQIWSQSMTQQLVEHAGPESARHFPEITVIKLRYSRKEIVSLFPNEPDPEVEV